MQRIASSPKIHPDRPSVISRHRLPPPHGTGTEVRGLTMPRYSPVPSPLRQTSAIDFENEACRRNRRCDAVTVRRRRAMAFPASVSGGEYPDFCLHPHFSTDDKQVIVGLRYCVYNYCEERERLRVLFPFPHSDNFSTTNGDTTFSAWRISVVRQREDSQPSRRWRISSCSMCR